MTQSGRRAICTGCDRPQRVCLCSALVRLEADIELVIWQDPDESRHRLSTAPLLQKSIVGSRLVVADDQNPESLLGDDWQQSTLLLYPLAHRPALEAADCLDGSGRPLFQRLLVLDGTWRKVKRLLLRNPWLETLPYLQLAPEQPGCYAPIRKSPRSDGLSTLEAAASALNLLHPQRDFSDITGVLKKMVALQQEQQRQAQQQGPGVRLFQSWK